MSLCVYLKKLHLWPPPQTESIKCLSPPAVSTVRCNQWVDKSFTHSHNSKSGLNEPEILIFSSFTEAWALCYFTLNIFFNKITKWQLKSEKNWDFQEKTSPQTQQGSGPRPPHGAAEPCHPGRPHNISTTGWISSSEDGCLSDGRPCIHRLTTASHQHKGDSQRSPSTTRLCSC